MLRVGERGALVLDKVDEWVCFDNCQAATSPSGIAMPTLYIALAMWRLDECPTCSCVHSVHCIGSTAFGQVSNTCKMANVHTIDRGTYLLRRWALPHTLQSEQQQQRSSAAKQQPAAGTATTTTTTKEQAIRPCKSHPLPAKLFKYSVYHRPPRRRGIQASHRIVELTHCKLSPPTPL